MPVKLVCLRPREALMFRDSRPFDAGLQVSARSQLPEPGTLFGAVRTAALQQVCADLSAYGQGRRCRACERRPDCLAVSLAGPPGSPGAPSHPGSLRCLGGVIADEAGTLFVPRPHLLVEVEDGLAIRAPSTWTGAWNAGVTEAALPGPCVYDGPLPEWVRVEDLAVLLSGRMPELALPGWATDGGPAALEPRVGLARTDKGVAMDGYLYRAEFRRYRTGIGPAAAVEAPDGCAWSPTVHLGGRSRTADVMVTDLDWPPIEQPATAPGRYAVAIVTSGWFAAGWHPRLPNDVTVAAAVVAVQEPSQGWDLACGQPRPMRWVCPAGSVWWLDAATQQAAEQLVGWHGRPLCEDRPHAGYGLAFVGRWEGTHGTS
jgi:hypothetical protein